MEFVIVSHVMCLIKVELGRRYAIESKTRVDGRIRHVWADALRSVGELHAGHQRPAWSGNFREFAIFPLAYHAILTLKHVGLHLGGGSREEGVVLSQDRADADRPTLMQGTSKKSDIGIREPVQILGTLCENSVVIFCTNRWLIELPR